LADGCTFRVNVVVTTHDRLVVQFGASIAERLTASIQTIADYRPGKKTSHMRNVAMSGGYC
jgi:hypothetical protein